MTNWLLQVPNTLVKQGLGGYFNLLPFLPAPRCFNWIHPRFCFSSVEDQIISSSWLLQQCTCDYEKVTQPGWWINHLVILLLYLAASIAPLQIRLLHSTPNRPMSSWAPPSCCTVCIQFPIGTWINSSCALWKWGLHDCRRRQALMYLTSLCILIQICTL